LFISAEPRPPREVRDRTRPQRRTLVYVCASAFFALFGAVYEHFGHGVWSYYMVYAFAVPLFCGALPWALSAAGVIPPPGRLSSRFQTYAVAVLTLGCLLRGVLDIYGTSNRLMVLYAAAGLCLLCAAVAAYVAERVGSGRPDGGK
jgi:hypothetical protein